MLSTKCYTFYSYKGGSGRSTTAINTVKHLIDELGVSEKSPILLVDADLESAGLTYFFKLEKKFTNNFRESIHTTKLLKDADNILEQDGKIIFGKEEDAKKPLNPVTVNRLKNLYGKSTKEIDVIFSKDFRMPSYAANMLQDIAEIHEKNEKSGRNTLVAEEIPLTRYDLPKIMDELVKLQENSDSLTEEQLKERKIDIICSYLPANQFVDISEYFDCEEGCVKFLGVDVKYQGEQTVRTSATDSLDLLINYCSKMGYAAVIFDSGAGVQSTAHALNISSDVIVYCMRPTLQFIKGTNTQLSNYENELKVKTGEKKKVILLPTAVSIAQDNALLRKKSFDNINELVENHKKYTDSTFCSEDNSLNEVDLFKWNEMILGVKNLSLFNASTQEILKQYTDEKTMPEDAKRAYETYAALAKRIVFNS